MGKWKYIGLSNNSAKNLLLFFQTNPSCQEKSIGKCENISAFCMNLVNTALNGRKSIQDVSLFI